MLILTKLFFNSALEAQKSGEAILLNDLIGSGNDRDCWRMPSDHMLCVKVAKPEQERPQNEIDFHYAKHLKRKNIISVHMPAVYGWVLTDKGPGLVFDLIQDIDGQTSKQILDSLQTGRIDLILATELVNEAFDWLIEKHVILADYGINNLLVQNYAIGKYRLVIVDGLGARNFGWRYWLNRNFGFKAVIKAKEFRQMTIDIMTQAVESGFKSA